MNTLHTRQNPAGWLAKTGDPTAAVEESLALIPDFTRALGAEHPTALDTRWDLVRYQGRNGNTAAALRQFQEVLAVGDDQLSSAVNRNEMLLMQYR